jgi:tetratricopeptide (TPR) repeat protein
MKLHSMDKAYHYRGKLWLDKEEYGKAIEDNTKALKINPKLWVAYHDRSKAYSHLNLKDAAERDLMMFNVLQREKLFSGEL